MKSMLRSCSTKWLLAVTTLVMVGRLQAADPVNVVSPATFKDKEGEGDSAFFSGGPGTDVRVQQFYQSANFVGFLPNGGYIKEISFRTDGKAGTGRAAVLPFVEIHLGYAGGFNQISREYAKNQGTGYSLVYSGSLSIPAMTRGQYDIKVVLQTPFLYNPNAGNLMLDYVNFGSGGDEVGLVDRTDTSVETAFMAGSRLSSQANGLIDGGLITRFTIDPVPEPGSAALLVFGGVVLAVVRRKNKP